MTSLRCCKHGIHSPVQCDNILDSGLQCPNSTCGDCWDYCDKSILQRHSKATLYCYFCVNVLTSRIVTNTKNKESFYDLTQSNSTSDNSSMDYCTFIPEPDDRNQTTIISPCRKLFINDDDYNSSSNDSSSVSDTDV